MKFNPHKDYYSILSVAQTADAKAIHHAYRKLVSRYHPDRHQGNDLEELAREKLVEINEAYEVLSKADIRAAYDDARFVAGGRAAREPAAPGNGNEGATPASPGSTLKKLFGLLALLTSLPFVFRFVRSPRLALVIGIAILLAWFGPRLLKRLKK